jgi:hypothetical protein
MSDDDPKDAIRAAEIAVAEDNLDVALDALHEAKSRVLKLRQEEQK